MNKSLKNSKLNYSLALLSLLLVNYQKLSFWIFRVFALAQISDQINRMMNWHKSQKLNSKSSNCQTFSFALTSSLSLSLHWHLHSLSPHCLSISSLPASFSLSSPNCLHALSPNCPSLSSLPASFSLSSLPASRMLSVTLGLAMYATPRNWRTQILYWVLMP